MKSILVHISGGPGQPSRVETGLSLARAFTSHVTFCQPAPPPIVVGGLAPGTLWSAVTFEDYAAKTEEARTQQRGAIKEKMASEDVPWDLCEVEGFTQEAFVSQTGLADLAIVSLMEEDSPFATDAPFLSHVVTHAACPVLAMPQDMDGFDPFGQAMIGWDGSMEAAAAVKAALPLLAKASGVMAVSVGTLVGKPGLDELASYLSRHGISISTDAVPADGHVSQTLLEIAKEIEASYLVMGAYGHSRLLEIVLGGETERMLRQSQVPIVFGR